MKSESIVESIGIEKIINVSNANGGCTEQPSRGVPAASSSQDRQPSRTMTDKDYARRMEDCYGILNEGTF